MALVTPSADDIVKEGFRRVAGRDPDAKEAKRALDFWMEEVLAEIWQTASRDDTVRFKHLENTAMLCLAPGQRTVGLPEDFHRPISLALYDAEKRGVVGSPTYLGLEAGAMSSYGYPDEGAGDGQAYLMQRYDEDWGTFTTGQPLGLSGRRIAFVREWSPLTNTWSGRNVAGLTRTISQSFSFSGMDGPDFEMYVHLLDDVWESPRVPEVDDVFYLLKDCPRTWVAEEMAEELAESGFRQGVGVPMRFSIFDNTLEFDVAIRGGANATVLEPDDPYRFIELRYWVNILKIDKDSDVMKRILTNWRVPLVKGIAKITAHAIDDARYPQFRDEFAASVVSLVNHDYEYGPRFAGFSVR